MIIWQKLLTHNRQKILNSCGYFTKDILLNGHIQISLKNNRNTRNLPRRSSLS